MLLYGIGDGKPGYYTNNASTANVPTIAQMMEMVKQLPPLPPPPDPKRCAGCKGHFYKGEPVTVVHYDNKPRDSVGLPDGLLIFPGPPLAYLCSACRASLIERSTLQCPRGEP